MLTFLGLLTAQWIADLLRWHWCDPCLVWVVAWGLDRQSWREQGLLLLAVGLLADCLHWGALGSRMIPLLALAGTLRYLTSLMHIHNISAQVGLAVAALWCSLAVQVLWRGADVSGALSWRAIAHAVAGIVLLRLQGQWRGRRRLQ